MSQQTTGMSRRRAIALASASIAGAALPSWPEAAVAAVEPGTIGAGRSQSAAKLMGGSGGPGHMVVLEFDSPEKAMAWVQFAWVTRRSCRIG